MSSLKQTINSPETKSGRYFSYFIQILIIISMITFSVSTLPNLSSDSLKLLRIVQISLVIAFTCEYFLRIWAANKPLKYVFSFFGIIDLLSILPFYLSLGIDLRALKAVRLLRLFRILKLVRYNNAVKRFHLAFVLVKEEFILFLFSAMILLYFSAVGIYYFENTAQPEVFASIFDSLWWSTATLTTVGYGDIYPITLGGKIFTFFVLFIGLGIVAIPAGIFASALSKAREMLDSKEKSS